MVFVLINLPKGDYITTRAAELERQGSLRYGRAQGLYQRYGLDKPLYVQYWMWITKFVRGDFGESFAYNMPVAQLIGQHMLLTVVLSLATMLFAWCIAIPIGVYSATHQYTLGDQLVTFMSFAGLATPSFLLALILMVISVYVFNTPISGLFSPGMERRLNMAKVGPAQAPLAAGDPGGSSAPLAGARDARQPARRPRQQYVMSARGRGLKEGVVRWKHAVRMAINPLISMLGMSFPNIVSGSTIISIVLSLPTSGPLLYRALRVQDMHPAGSFLMLLSVMLILGNFCDLALACIPCIAYE